MIYFVLKTIEANWQVDKQSKNLRQVKEIAEKQRTRCVNDDDLELSKKAMVRKNKLN